LEATERASWKGILSLNIPNMGLGSVQYRLRAGKAHGENLPIKVIKVDNLTNREVVRKKVGEAPASPVIASNPTAVSTPIPPTATFVNVKIIDKFFYKDEVDAGTPLSMLTSVPDAQVQERQETADGNLIETFDRTTKIEVEPDGFVGLGRLPEYKFKEIYQFGADTSKEAKEDSNRVLGLARYLLEKQTALVSFFSWGRGYQYYTAVIYPYERKDGKLWLLMGLSEGVLALSDNWALVQKPITQEVVTPMPEAKPKAMKPKVTISK